MKRENFQRQISSYFQNSTPPVVWASGFVVVQSCMVILRLREENKILQAGACSSFRMRERAFDFWWMAYELLKA